MQFLKKTMLLNQSKIIKKTIIMLSCLSACLMSVQSLAQPLHFYNNPTVNFEVSTLEGLNNTAQLSVEFPFLRFAAGGIEVFMRPYDKLESDNNHAPQYGLGGRLELHRHGSFETGLYGAIFMSSQFTPETSISTINADDDHFEKLEKTPCHANSFNMGMTTGYQWFLTNGLNASIGGGFEAVNHSNIFNPECNNEWQRSRVFGEVRLGFAI